MIITIDGPTASGKSTMAKILAKELGYYYLYSGMLFRALGYLLVTDAHYTEQMLQQAKKEDIDCYTDPVRLRYAYTEKGEVSISFEGRDITHYLKDAHIDRCASIIGTQSYVREKLLHMQRVIGKTYNLIVDGRDSGSAVFPDADVKFFLTAEVSERARRWQIMQEQKGQRYTLEQALSEIEERDVRDTTRACDPLQIPKDAIIIDSTRKDIRDVVLEMIRYIV